MVGRKVGTSMFEWLARRSRGGLFVLVPANVMSAAETAIRW